MKEIPFLYRFMILLVVFIQPHHLSQEHKDFLLIWNVGQGQWVSWIQHNRCSHFDMGGEWPPPSRLIRTLCGNRPNEIYFSHWDWDHIGLLQKVRRKLSQLCVARRPPGNPRRPRKKNLLNSVPACTSLSSTKDGRIKELYPSQRLMNPSHSNSQSRIFNINQHVLVTGDSPSRQERFWLHQLSSQNQIFWLIAGHHGSRTSNSNELIKTLRGLRQVIASARSRRYGHPHKQVCTRFKRAGVSLIETEKWGNIIIDLPSNP